MGHTHRLSVIATGAICLLCLTGAAPRAGTKSVVMTAMESELERTLKELKPDPEAPLYFLGYTVTESSGEVVSATNGVIAQEDAGHSRVLDVSARVGSPELDNTHEIRGGGGGPGFGGGGGATAVPLDDDVDAIRGAIWLATDQRIKAAQERFIRVRANRAIKVEEEHAAPDFSKEEPQLRIDPLPTLDWDRGAWRNRVRDLSRHLRRFPFVLDGSVTLSTSNVHTFQANSEGTRLQFGRTHVRLNVYLEGKADDGMSLLRSESFDAREFSGLPKDEVVVATIDRLAKELEALRKAPMAEPFTGPAILRNRASGVFFHEIFGHRIEGHRQKLSDEGQTFARKVGEPILPSFLSVVDDPTTDRMGGQDLNGYYPFDDEGVPSRRVTLVQNGVLKEFLQSRSPLSGFPRSNGHGRRQPGRDAVSRQGNLMVLSTKQVPFTRLRQMLVEECRRQQKPYGLIFDDISGGYTTTTRSGPQAFKVLPLLVTRVYADGRPDQLLRGADLVGTPLVSFSKILATADDAAVFNGHCGAESGWVPVSAVSPSILVGEIEVEKRAKEADRPPLLPVPAASDIASPIADSRSGSGEPINPKSKIDNPKWNDDPTMQAMADELARSRSQLKMETFAPPYFIAYSTQDMESVTVAARMGALVSSDQNRGRQLWADVRVGDATLDNTNFFGRGGFSGADSLPLESRYETDRRALWLATDQAYKQAVETLASKRAALQQQASEPRPPDLGKAAPHTFSGPPAAWEVDREGWEKTARAVSAVFRRFPALEDGQVGLRAERQTRRFLNSEGSWNRVGTALMEVTLRASTRAADGTEISDFRRFHARRSEDLPSQTQLTAAAESLAQSLAELAAAGQPEEYTGPVLFTGQAATVFFDRLLADKLADPALPVSPNPRAGQAMRADRLTGQLGRKILPAGFHVVDDPTRDTLDGIPLLGSYPVDDDGVPAEPVTLVEDGTLRAFYMSRIPTKEIAATNGHGRRGPGGRVTGQPANLLVTAESGAADLKERLKALCREEGLPYGLLVERFEAVGAGPRGGGFGRGRFGRGPGGADPGERSDLPDSIGLRKVHVDGKEEVLRGGRFRGVTVRTLRSVVAAGTDRNAMTRRLAGAGPDAVTLVVPSVLVAGLDVLPTEGGAEKPRFIPRPPVAGVER
jgi:TldD protein